MTAVADLIKEYKSFGVELSEEEAQSLIAQAKSSDEWRLLTEPSK